MRLIKDYSWFPVDAKETVEAVKAVYEQFYSHVEYLGKPMAKYERIEDDPNFLVLSKTSEGPDVPIERSQILKVNGVWRSVGEVLDEVCVYMDYIGRKINLIHGNIGQKALEIFYHTYSERTTNMIVQNILENFEGSELAERNYLWDMISEKYICFETVEDIFKLAQVNYFPADKYTSPGNN